MATAKLTIELDGVPTAIKSLADMRNAAQSLEEQLSTADYGSAEFDKIAAQLAKVKSALKQVDETTDGLSMEAKAGAIGGAVAGLAASFAVAEGAAALFGSESEQLQKTMLKVQAAMAVAGGVQQLAAGLAQAQKAMTAFGISTKAAMGPIAIFLAAAAAIAAAMLLMQRNTTSAEKAQESFGEALKEQAPELAKERLELDALSTKLEATTAGTQERTDALMELQAKYPEYISNLDVEKAKTGEVADVIDIATKAMENRIRMMAAQTVAQDAMTKQVTAELELRRLAREAGFDVDNLQKGEAEFKRFKEIIAATGAAEDGLLGKLEDTVDSYGGALSRNFAQLFAGNEKLKKGFAEVRGEASGFYRDFVQGEADVRAALALAAPLNKADAEAKARAASANRALAASLVDKLGPAMRDEIEMIRALKKMLEDMAQAERDAMFAMIDDAERAAQMQREIDQQASDALWAQVEEERERNAYLAAQNKGRTAETKEQANERIEIEKAEAKARQDAAIQMGEQIAGAVVGMVNAFNDLLNQMDANALAQLDRQVQAVQAAMQATDQMLSESADRQKELEGDLAHSSVDQRNKVLHLMDKEAEKSKKLQEQKAKEAKEEQKLEAEKKKIALQQFERNKKIQEGQAIINTAGAVIKALVDAPFPLDLVLSVAAGVTGALQIATIEAQQPPSFAEGGWTGMGFGQPDKSGYRVAGVVHEGEYVIPQPIAQSPQYQPIIQQIELARANGKGYAGGGPVEFGGQADMSGMHERLDTLNARIEELAKRPVYVEIRKVNAAQQEVAATEARARL